MKVPFLDISKQSGQLHDSIIASWSDILTKAEFIGGHYVDTFEKQFAQACRVKHAVSVGSGTDALIIILRALGVQSGDEVIIPVNTFIATAEAVSHCGATPVFTEVEQQSYNIDPFRIEECITPRTRGIIAVHLYGNPAKMDTITDIAKQYNLWVIEDACQAHLAEYRGKTIGSISIASAFSFYPGKNLGGCGEGGAVTTHDDDLAQKIRKLRDHGQSTKYHHEMVGYNGRCDALQAAALLVKLPYLAGWNAKRRDHAQTYSSLLTNTDVVLPEIAQDVLPAFHLYVVLVHNRDFVQKMLSERGIASALHYPIPLHLQPAYKHLGYALGDFPIAEKCSEKLLSLPIYPELTFEQIQYVCDNLIEITANAKSAG